MNCDKTPRCCRLERCPPHDDDVPCRSHEIDFDIPYLVPRYLGQILRVVDKGQRVGLEGQELFVGLVRPVSKLSDGV